jgi:hypothetical protein
LKKQARLKFIALINLKFNQTSYRVGRLVAEA